MSNSELDAICDPKAFILKYITDADIRSEKYLYGNQYNVSVENDDVNFEVHEPENVINLVDDIGVGRVHGISDDIGVLHFAIAKGNKMLFIFSLAYEDSSYGDCWIQALYSLVKFTTTLKVKPVVVLG